MRTELTVDDPACPDVLHQFLLQERPLTLTVSRPLALPRPVGPNRSPRAIAIIGSREPSVEALTFAGELARTVVAAGGVVISGGALGIDGAAHVAALDAGGITWCVAPFAPGRPTPRDHRALFERIEASDGGMLWTLPTTERTSQPHFHVRNAVLVSLADLVIVVEADRPSGTWHAANTALRSKRDVRVVRPAAWTTGFAGSRALLRQGRAKPLESMDEMRALLELPPLVSADDAEEGDEGGAQLSLDLSPDQLNLLKQVTQSPQHVDEIAHSAGLRSGRAATLLLTLALENVVVEGPSGFFRRQQLL